MSNQYNNPSALFSNAQASTAGLIGFSLGHDILKRQIENEADENNKDDKNGLENMIQRVYVLHSFHMDKENRA